MVYIMEIYVDGACRRNGQYGATGVAAAVFKCKWDKIKRYYRLLPEDPTPTNQRAELAAIIIALQQALSRYQSLHSNPYLEVTVYSDSRYAIGCMNQWLNKWMRNGWVNAAGRGVANRDLIEEASDLTDKVNELGSVDYVWIPREENQLADELCNEVLDDQVSR